MLIRNALAAVAAPGCCGAGALLLMLALTLALAPPGYTQPQYTVNFGQPPKDWNAALSASNLASHRATVLGFLACHEETQFLLAKDKFHHVDDHDNEDDGEDLVDYLLAKLVWLKTNRGDCTFGETSSFDAPSLNTAEKKAFPNGECDAVAQVVVPNTTITVSRNCMQAQINVVLSTMSQGDLQLGSSGLPCYWTDPTHLFDGFHFTKTHGEWDATLRVLVRLFYLDSDDPRGREFGAIIVDDPGKNWTGRTNLEQNLLSIDGSPAQESYSSFQCGNQERSTGSAQDRADEPSWLDDVIDSLGDLFSWLTTRLLFLAIVLAVPAIAGELLPIVGGLVGVIGAVGLAGILGVAAFLRIPETENHLMQINSAKFLINQLVINELKNSGGDPGHLRTDQSATRDWLLAKMQSMVKNDFIEYNAIPYQRYTLGALMNLADFTSDDAVKTGAKLVLEYYMAKYAIGSSELRRYSPFRRRAEVLNCYLVDPQPTNCDGESGAPVRNIFDLAAGANHAIGLMQFYAGPSSALYSVVPIFVDPVPGERYVSEKSTEDMLFAATSKYVPQPLTVALALDKSIPYFQRIRLLDGGAEIVSSGRSVLIGGGGVITAHANLPYYAGIIPVGFAVDLVGDGDSDKGAAWPIVLIPHGHAADWMNFDRLIHFNGERVDLARNNGAWSYDHNLCIARNFACGRDLVIPQDFKPCAGLPPDRNGWFFFDSWNNNCPASRYREENHFFAAGNVAGLYSVNGVFVRWDGFIEVVDATDGMSFDAFVQTVRQRNPGPLNGIHGVYQSFSGHAINFDADAGILAVDNVLVPDVKDWPHASGDILSGSWTDAVVTISNPGYPPLPGAPPLPSSLRLDFTDRNNPHLDTVP